MSTEGDEWFLIAVTLEQKEFLVLYEVWCYLGAIMVKVNSWVGAISLLVWLSLFGVQYSRDLVLLLDQIGESYGYGDHAETTKQLPLGTFLLVSFALGCGVWPGVSDYIFRLRLS